MHEAKQSRSNEVIVWGTGEPRREFLYSDDMADACLQLMSLPDPEFNDLIADYPPLINIGCGTDMTIRELAETVARVVGFEGKLRFDTSKPDGTPRKLLDINRLRNLNWGPQTSLEQGLELVYREFSSSEVSCAD